MTKALFPLLAASMVLTGCDRGPPPPEKTAQQLMAEDVEPAAQIYWKSVQYISDESGEHDIFPRTDEEWGRVEAAAKRLGELGALLQTPGYAEGRGDDWIQISQSLVDVSKLAEQAAAEKNTAKVFEVGGTMYSVCSGCHQVYPPAEGLPEETAAEAPPV